MRRVRSVFISGTRSMEVSSKDRESKVVPDQSLKVRDIVKRFIKGAPVEDINVQKGVYPEEVSHDSPDLAEIQRMDPVEKLEFARNFRVNMKPEEKPVVKPEGKPEGKTEGGTPADKPTE